MFSTQLSRVVALTSAVLVLAAGAHALPNVTRAGRYLYTEDGNRFFIKGIAYQEQGAHGVSLGGSNGCSDQLPGRRRNVYGP